MKKIVTFLIPLIFILAFFVPGMLIKAKIMCFSSDKKCPVEIEKSLAGLNNKSIYSAKRRLKKILSDNFLVLEYSTQYKLPNILEVNILEKKPVFAIKLKDNNTYYLVDPAGYVLSETAQTELPYVILSTQSYTAGEKIDDKIFFSLNLIEGIYKMYQTKYGFIEEDALTVELPGKVNAILPLADSDRDFLLGSLRLIYSNIRDGEENSYTQIDMRYKNPVLR